MTSRTGWALRTFAVGFLIESGTEAYQLASTGGAEQSAWLGFYYIGLVTTVAGFYLIHRGRHEWTEAHRRHVHRGHQSLAISLAMFVSAALVLGLIADVAGPALPSRVPVWAVALVGGLVALSLGNFFLGLVLVVIELVGPWGRALAWAGFAWSLGVAGLAGFAVGEQIQSLLASLVSDPLSLVVRFAPLAFLLSPLCVTYGAFAAVYISAERRLESHYRAPTVADSA